jgi:hypothetical protein
MKPTNNTRALFRSAYFKIPGTTQKNGSLDRCGNDGNQGDPKIDLSIGKPIYYLCRTARKRERLGTGTA